MMWRDTGRTAVCCPRQGKSEATEAGKGKEDLSPAGFRGSVTLPIP